MRKRLGKRERDAAKVAKRAEAIRRNRQDAPDPLAGMFHGNAGTKRIKGRNSSVPVGRAILINAHKVVGKPTTKPKPKRGHSFPTEEQAREALNRSFANLPTSRKR